MVELDSSVSVLALQGRLKISPDSIENFGNFPETQSGYKSHGGKYDNMATTPITAKAEPSCRLVNSNTSRKVGLKIRVRTNGRIKMHSPDMTKPTSRQTV